MMKVHECDADGFEASIFALEYSPINQKEWHVTKMRSCNFADIYIVLG